MTSMVSLFLLGNESIVPPVVLLILVGFMLIAGGCAWSIRKDLIADMDDTSTGDTTAEPNCAESPARTFPRDLTIRIRLESDQQHELLQCYHRQYTDQHVWPDIKLEAFACDVQNWRPGRTITVYFAQRRIVREFAEQNGLQWLTDQLQRSRTSIDVPAREAV